MKKIVLSMVGVVVVAVAGFVGMVWMQPSALEVSASTTVNAGAADVEPFLRDLRKMNEWSPWIGIDPDLKMEYAPSTSGVGAWYTWEGNDEVGKGMMTIEVDEASKTVHRIDFEKPFAGVATSTVTWKGTDTRTTVTWTFRQQADFGTKAANLFMDIEGMLAKDYDKGLALLKPIVEAAHTERLAAEKRAAEKLATEKATENAADAAQALPPG